MHAKRLSSQAVFSNEDLDHLYEKIRYAPQLFTKREGGRYNVPTSKHPSSAECSSWVTECCAKECEHEKNKQE